MPTTTTRDGTEINYEAAGGGSPPLLLVHGWCSNLSNWHAQVQYFRGSHRVVAVDRRGHGRSAIPAGGYTARQHAADLAEVAAAEQLSAAIVIGHAGGGPAVLELARSQPDLVSALVLVDTIVSGPSDFTDPDDPAGRRLGGFISGISGPDGDAYFLNMYRGFFSSNAGAVAEEAVRAATLVPPHVAVAELESLSIDSAAIAAQVEQPVLWLTAESANTPSLRETFRNVQFGQVVGSGHFPQLEVPDQVNAMIARFISTL